MVDIQREVVIIQIWLLFSGLPCMYHTKRVCNDQIIQFNVLLEALFQNISSDRNFFEHYSPLFIDCNSVVGLSRS